MLQAWKSMPVQKRVVAVLSVMATIAVLYALVSATLKPKLDLLYAGLDPSAAGDVIAKLDGMGVAYEVRGGAIYTDIKKRDSLRLELAREGLPRQAIVGYELFDDVNSFAMTSEMFDTTYWRAKEGELARTILAMPSIQTARVHFGMPKTTGFSRRTDTLSASVTVSTGSGLNAQQTKAVQYLTALSVSGLNPDDVAVIDTVKGLVAGPGLEPDRNEAGSGEMERAASLKRDLLSMLEARVGLGNARVNVTLDIDRNHETSVERTFDPEGRVVKTQTTKELTDTSTGSAGAVTVASNLPEGAGGAGERSSNRNESNESLSYEISELVRNTEKMPGTITRMTVAILVNDAMSTDEDGVVNYEPRSDTELADLRALVLDAAGLNLERGDTLTIKNLTFEQMPQGEVFEQPSLIDKFLDQYLWGMIQSGFLGLVALILGLFVIRPLLRTQQASVDPSLRPINLNESSDPSQLPAPEIAGHLADSTSLDPVETLKKMANEQPENSTELLTKWLGETEHGTA